MLVIHAGLFVLVTAQAGEDLILTSVGMALSTRGPFAAMFPRINSERAPVVVEDGRTPCCCGMAGRAVVAELRGDVIGSLIELGRMTLIAVLIGERVVIVGVAGNACCGGVSAGEREGRAAVIEGGRAPCRLRVTEAALGREPVCGMGGIGCRVVVRTMAADACRLQSPEAIAGMTVRARGGGVRPHQGKRRAGMIEPRPPRTRGWLVTLQAVGGELR